MKKIHVKTGVPYDILIERGLLPRCGELIGEITSSRHTVIVTDDRVNKLYTAAVRESLEQSGFTVDVFVFPNGEMSKCHPTLIALYSFLSEKQITRKDILIALGGGVVGDLAGFAAATYLRGIDFVQIPTTLLAQIDSSVGGKTGVDIESGKNLVGAFHQPRLVLCDPDTLATLTPEIRNDGVAEAIKYGAIKSRSLFDKLAQSPLEEILDDVIYECVDIKRRVVEEDEFDNGERMLLNFGHTLGHAVEKIFNYTTYTHGQGVAVGMYIITELSEHYGLTKPGEAAQIKRALEKYNLPTDSGSTATELITNSLNDKKRSKGDIHIILIKEIGQGYIQKLTLDQYKQFIQGVYTCE